jgi:hypothetical protein
MNREEWLMKATEELATIFQENGKDVPEVRVSVGFPSKGGSRGKLKTIGECHPSAMSADGRAQIFIHPTLDSSVKVLGVLLHELVHAVLGAGFGHKKEFKALATACGLTGKMTATSESPELVERLNEVIGRIGQYPHAKLDTSSEKKQGTRMKKCLCPNCGYIAYTSQKWLDEVGTPTCSGCYIEMDEA